MKLAREPLAAIRPELEGLLALHYEELTKHKDVVKLKPDWGKYEALDAQGALPIYTARDAGRLIGYAIFFLAFHLHYSDVLCATNDVLFLHPDYRQGSAGLRLVRYADDDLSNRVEADRIFWHLKFNTHGAERDLQPVFKRMGYAPEEVVVGRVIKRG